MSTVEGGHLGVRDRVFRTGAMMLSVEPYLTVSLERVATDADVSLTDAMAEFPSMHSLGVAILDHERASMQTAQAAVARESDPVQRIIRAFKFVGENLSHDVAVRAGVRMAGESRREFPERRLDPFLTWRSFVHGQLMEYLSTGGRTNLDVDRAIWVIIAAGMGAKELLAVRGDWSKAPAVLAQTAEDVLELVVRQPGSSRLRDVVG